MRRRLRRLPFGFAPRLKLIASGGDVVDNLVRISYSLNSILGRIDRGEGLVGQLTSEQPGGVGDQLQQTLGAAQRVMADLEAGKGTLGRVLRDDAMAARLDGAVASLESVLRNVEQGDGLLGTLAYDRDVSDDAKVFIRNLRQQGILRYRDKETPQDDPRNRFRGRRR